MASLTMAGVFLIGLGVGVGLPALPSQIAFINPYLGLVLIIVGIILIVKSH